MIALKDDPIWDALGNWTGEDENGKEVSDSLGNPYPPFAFNSGMWFKEVARPECYKLGLLQPTQKQNPPAVPSLREGIEANVEGLDLDLQGSLLESLGAAYGLVQGIMRLLNTSQDRARTRQRLAGTFLALGRGKLAGRLENAPEGP
jgi:hypothetical protein